MIIAQLASIPARHSILHRVVSTLIDQVDEIHLNLAIDIESLTANDDESGEHSYQVSSWMKHAKIKLTFHDNSLEDGSKFINAPTESGHYVLVCDDDIGYPPGFANHMIRLLKDPFKNRPILSCMGKVLKSRPIGSYFKDELFCAKTFETQKAFYAVEIPGTCAMAYCTDHVVITSADMKSPNSDICVGAWAKKNDVRCYVIPHGAKWLMDLTSLLPNDSPNMFDRYKEDDSILTKFINENL
jgi:hypothetical protein